VNPSEGLQRRCEDLRDGGAEAIDWILDAGPEIPRLEREAPSLIHKIRQVRNLAGRLGRAAARPLSVGFFGLSQAGKSYLISALAAGRNGELETDLDGERLNFIAHVNPVGGGKEATGLVTRFTREVRETPRGFPLALSLFSEVDLVKVLGNAFYNDFDQQRFRQDTTSTHIRAHLAALAKRRRPRPTGGMEADDVVDIQDYFVKRVPGAMEALRGDYWPTAVELAPYLEPADRTLLFSILWGEVEELTGTHRMLSEALAQTGHAVGLYCPITALVSRGEGGDWTQTGSIMNVDILEDLGRDRGDLLPVRPMPAAGGRAGGRPDGEIRLPRSLLAALTTELRFVLAEEPRAGLLERVDLLDFPGYRGRLKIADLAEVRDQLEGERIDPVAQLVLRAKVAYLFERYTDDQEMNVLVLCTPSDMQSEVEDLGRVLTTWVHATQGAGARDRAGREPGLVWAVTKFDKRLEPRPHTPDQVRQGWETLMKMTFERFSSDWVAAWTPNRPFDNLFLLRKPGLAGHSVATDGARRESHVLPDQGERLALLRSTFLESASIRAHVRDAAAAWDAMLTPNDGGMSRLAAYLERVCVIESKWQRIGEQLDAVVDELVVHRFGAYYYREGAAEVENKKRLAERVIAALRRRPDAMGELLWGLLPSDDLLRSLYLRTENQSGHRDERTRDREDPRQQSAPLGGLIDLDALLPADGLLAAPEPAAGDAATHFARAALGAWIGHLRELPENDSRTGCSRSSGMQRPRPPPCGGAWWSARSMR